MAELKNTELDIGITSDLELSLEAALSGDAFVQGDFFKAIMAKTKKPIDNPFMIRKTVMVAYGFYLNLAFGVGFKLPYFAKAQAQTKLEYGLSIPDMKIGIKSESGKFSVYFDPPKPVLKQDGLALLYRRIYRSAPSSRSQLYNSSCAGQEQSAPSAGILLARRSNRHGHVRGCHG